MSICRGKTPKIRKLVEQTKMTIINFHVIQLEPRSNGTIQKMQVSV